MVQRCGIFTNPIRNKAKLTKFENKTVNLISRLETYSEDVLRFTMNFNSPFSNNQAERDVRMVKLQQKISGSWRTKSGVDNFCAIRSYISTMKKHDYNVLDGLNRLFKNQVWLPGET
ncbi:IS66 family transposase [Ferrimicrobium acidiphilum]|uniref:IS66 family transposase n=1 Tax=Ferrimicrobium acidiphilum TaxID=121039 RepID=UPI003C6D8EF1